MKFGYFDVDGVCPAIMSGDKAVLADTSGCWRQGSAAAIFRAAWREVPEISRETLAALYPDVDLLAGEAILATNAWNGIAGPPDTRSMPPAERPSHEKPAGTSPLQLLVMERAMRRTGEEHNDSDCLVAAENLKRLREQMIAALNEEPNLRKLRLEQQSAEAAAKGEQGGASNDTASSLPKTEEGTGLKIVRVSPNSPEAQEARRRLKEPTAQEWAEFVQQTQDEEQEALKKRWGDRKPPLVVFPSND